MDAIEAMTHQQRGQEGGNPGIACEAQGGTTAAYVSAEVQSFNRMSATSSTEAVGAMVHAISNSLNAIMAATQLANLMIPRGRLDEAKVSLDQAEVECMHAARLLRDGRDLVMLIVPEPVAGIDISVLLDACAAACTDLGEVQVTCGEGLPRVHGQPHALKRMFVEILDNAFQYGAHNVAVTARADDQPGVVRIDFKDDGPGVCIKRERLFEPFTTSEPADHSGIGLAIAAKIAAASRGAIGLGESSRGATFWVRLAAEQG